MILFQQFLNHLSAQYYCSSHCHFTPLIPDRAPVVGHSISLLLPAADPRVLSYPVLHLPFWAQENLQPVLWAPSLPGICQVDFFNKASAVNLNREGIFLQTSCCGLDFELNHQQDYNRGGVECFTIEKLEWCLMGTSAVGSDQPSSCIQVSGKKSPYDGWRAFAFGLLEDWFGSLDFCHYFEGDSYEAFHASSVSECPSALVSWPPAWPPVSVAAEWCTSACSAAKHWCCLLTESSAQSV